MQSATEYTAELKQQIKKLQSSPLPSNLVYAEQAIDEIQNLKLYFSILQDIFSGSSPESEKLKKIEYLLGEFSTSFDCWSELAQSVLEAIAEET